MFKQLPFKKEYLLAVAAVLLLLISYQLAFKKTIAAWQLNHDLKGQLTGATDVSLQPGYQERKNSNLDRVIKQYQTDTTEFRSNVINKISAIAEKENVRLSGVPTRDPLYNTPQFLIQKLNFEGDYFSLIKVFNRLQSTKDIGLIRSSIFKITSLTSANEKDKKLTLEVYLEIVNR